MATFITHPLIVAGGVDENSYAFKYMQMIAAVMATARHKRTPILTTIMIIINGMHACMYHSLMLKGYVLYLACM